MAELKKNLKILISNLNLKNLEVYEDGELVHLKISNNNLRWDFYLNFDRVLRVNDYLDLSEKLIKKFNDERIEDVRVHINYPNKVISANVLEEYYNYFLDKNIKEKPRYSALKSINTIFENNKVQLYVATNKEIEIMESLLVKIMEDFLEFNLSFVEKAVSISLFETSIETVIKTSLEESNKELLKRQDSYDRAAGNIEEAPAKKEKVFKKKRATAEINGEVTLLKDVPSSETEVIEHTQRYGSNNFVVSGEIIKGGIRELKGYKLYEGVLYDGTNSITIKTFISITNGKNEEEFYRNFLNKGDRAKVFGYVEYDRYSRDVVLRIKDVIGLEKIDKNKITDSEVVKRVELHAHTKMSSQDGVMDVEEYVKQAKEFGHKAIAVTDHYNTQALPDLDKLAKKAGIKPIFGLEAAMIDEDAFQIAYTNESIKLSDACYVVYDVETTGLSSNYDEIIEIAAVKVKSGMIIDEFSKYVKPTRDIPALITELTSITNDDVRGARGIKDEITDFKKFIDGCILVAHNASFDNSHIYKNLRDYNLFDGPYPTIDTMNLARVKYGNALKSFNLKALSKYFDVELTQHHRAIYDARTTAQVFLKMLKDLQNDGIEDYKDINKLINREKIYTQAFSSHVNILSMNKEGLKNINKIVSDSHTVHFHKEARITKDFINKHRDNLLIGSSCLNGEVFDIAYRKPFEELVTAAEFYDYLEVQPVGHYRHLFNGEDMAYDEEIIKDTIKKIIKVAKLKKKLVVATGDVHILNKEDFRFREIFIEAQQVGGGVHRLHNAKNLATQHFMTTKEMLNEFEFLGEELAKEIVVTNTNLIADKIERYPLFPEELFAPSDDFMKDRGIPSFKEAVINLTYSKAKHLYGEDIPRYVKDRITKELDSIIGNNYASIYYISHLLVKHSHDDGYVVGSRGSVGSSLVAYFMDITEVNGLSPHYYCPKCHFSSFKLSKEEKLNYKQSDIANSLDPILQGVGTGFDLPDQLCPVCNTDLLKDGIDIPFETFLGFEGDKVPDIDLNFSSEYQAKAHDFCRELFGVDHAFRAGTIGTIADKTAYGYVKGYLERNGIAARECEVSRLAEKITGVKRSTGQHPGGIVVIPKEIEFTDLISVQYPADDTKSTWRTTHYDYHKFESNLLKLDILGHDDPTMIRHLMDFVEAEPDKFPFKTVEEIPIADPFVINLFSDVESLGVDETMISESVGTTGIPEFGTSLAKDMLREIRPKSINELIKISGLSHGTDVWRGNARDYMLGLKPEVGKIAFKDLIGCRDDIMVYLVSKGLPAIDAFKIMESVRKGRGLTDAQEKQMLSFGVQSWYISSCNLIKYMFPKAHAAAYVIMALRIAWFKVHRPLYFYSAYFSRRAKEFDIVTMAKGYNQVSLKVKELATKIENKQATSKEIDTHYTLLLSLEMLARGFKFKQIDIKRSDWRDFLIEDNSLLIPFKAMESLGENTAKSITDARNEQMFTSKKDVVNRTKINSTLYEKLNQVDAFLDLPNDDQIKLF